MSDETKEKEIWKQYPKYPWIEASNLGRVRTKDRTIVDKNGKKRFVKGRVLKQHLDNNGYLCVRSRVNGKLVHLRVHRIVAISFIPNPNNYPEVNHKDNDRTNATVSNLEWCSKQYNLDYKNNFGTSPADVQGKSVIAVNLKTGKVLKFELQYEAARQLEILAQNINKVLKGRMNKTHDYWFCYVNENVVEKVRAKFGDKVANEVEKLMV